MTLNLKFLKFKMLFLTSILTTTLCSSQTDTNTWKLQLALGINDPIEIGVNGGYYSNYINFPSINLGVQYMFGNNLGAKLDFGYNRSSNADGSLEFKLNYTRMNAQLVYNFSSMLSFLPERIQVVGHAGPGISMTQPLGNFADNKYTFLNALGSLELHYGLSREVSVYGDLSYALALTNKEKYDLNVDGFSFNGDLIYASIGISVSLGRNCYCNYE